MSRNVLHLADELMRTSTLAGIVPICMHCYKMGNDQDVWQAPEVYLAENSNMRLSHGLCPECSGEHYPDLNVEE